MIRLVLQGLRAIALFFAIGLVSQPAAADAVEQEAAICATGFVPIAGECVGSGQLAETIRDLVVAFRIEADLSAVIVNVRVGETEVLRDAFGTSMSGVPASPDMHFRNGAVAIAYLSTVLLRLQEQGLLSIDDPLSKWFPDYPRADKITLHMLITSTSGYADYVNLDILPLYEDPFRQYTPDELIAMGLSQPMVCDPGTCFAYAHTNFVILGEVMHKASGRSVEDLIQEYVLAPLGLENTRSEATAFIRSPVLHAFTAERGIYEDSTYWDPSWTLARGAVMTTDIDDLATSAIAIGEGTLLSPESHALQLAPSTAGMAPFNETVFYGMGVLVTNGWVIQTPSFAGYAAAMAYLPSQKITIALAATNGRVTPEKPRPTDSLFVRLGKILSPDQPPVFTR